MNQALIRLLSMAAVYASLASSSARAAQPSTADCLAASEASLNSGNQHLLRAERRQLLVCSASSCPADIRRECARRVEEVNNAIPTIIFETKGADGNDLSAVKLAMDGELLAERLDGTALSIDPGEHTFTFEIPGQSVVKRGFVIRQAQKDRREAILLGTAQAASASAVAPRAMAGVQSYPTSSPASETKQVLGKQRVAALAAAGVGVVGVGLGSVFGLVATSKKSDAHDVCPNQCSTQSGVDKWHEAQSSARLSDVFFVVGGVGLAAAVTLWSTAKKSTVSGPTVEAGLGSRGLQLTGAW